MDFKRLIRNSLMALLLIVSIFVFPNKAFAGGQIGANGDSQMPGGSFPSTGEYSIVNPSEYNDTWGPINVFTHKCTNRTDSWSHGKPHDYEDGCTFFRRTSPLPPGISSSEHFKQKCGQSDWVIASTPINGNLYYYEGMRKYAGADAILSWGKLSKIAYSSDPTARKIISDLKKNSSFVGRRVNLLCSFQVSGKTGNPTKKKTTEVNKCKASDNKPGNWKKVDNKQFSIKGTTKYQVIAEPVVPGNLNTLEPQDIRKWRETHKVQKSEIKKTKFGEYLDELNKDGTLARLKSSDYNKSKAEFEKVKAKAEKLVKEDEEMLKNLSMEVAFDEQNQTGLSTGGAYTISLETSETWLKVSTAKEEKVPLLCTNPGKPRVVTVCYNESNKKVGCNSPDVATIEERKIYQKSYKKDYANKQERTKKESVNLKIEFDRGFHHRRSYQFVNVVCNVEELKKIISSIEGEILSTGKHNNTITMMAKTKIKEGGDKKANWLTPRNMTVDFFYGGDCDQQIYCTAKPERALSGSDGKENKQNANAFTKDEKSLFGAQNEDKNTSFLQFFRDGDKKEVRNDVWTITTDDKENGLILPDKANSTDIGIWDKSTPNPLKENGEDSLLSVYVNDKLVDWNKGKKIPSGSDTQYRLSFAGEQNRINIASTWASEGKTDEYPEGRPVKMVSSYYYKPKVSSNTLSSVNINGQVTPVNKEEIITSVCDMYYNTLEDQGDKIYPTHGLIPEKGKFFPGRMEQIYGQFSNNRDLTINFVKSSRE